MSAPWRGAFLSGHINFQVLAMVQEPNRVTLRLSHFWRVMYVLAALLFAVVAPLAGAASWANASREPWKLVLVGIVAAGCWIWLYYLLFRHRRIEIELDTGNFRFYTGASEEVDFMIAAGDIDRLEMRGSGLHLHTRDGVDHHLLQTTSSPFVAGILEALQTTGPLAEIAKVVGKTSP